MLRTSYGENGFEITEAYKNFINTDSTNFSIFNPIVGITFEQAIKFCNWRESVVNLFSKRRLKITLPTIDTYKKINENRDSISSEEKERDSCRLFQYNYYHDECISNKLTELKSQGKGLVRVDRYPPTKLKLYCIQGNAAEMTSEKGIAVGGSFRHFANQSFGNVVQVYGSEEDWLGFRCYVSLE